MTKQEQYVEALKSKGFIEVEGRTKKYRIFKLPQREAFYFLGKSGAVRVGPNVSKSFAVSDAFKASLLV